MPIKEGNSVRFTGADYPVGSVQRAVANANAQHAIADASPSPVPTNIPNVVDANGNVIVNMQEALNRAPRASVDAVLAERDRRLEDAWRNPRPQQHGGGE